MFSYVKIKTNKINYIITTVKYINNYDAELIFDESVFIDDIN